MKRFFSVVLLVSVAAHVAATGTVPNGQLKLAVIITRHGVRSPLWTVNRLNQDSAEPWPAWDSAPGNLTSHGRALMTTMGAFYRDLFASEKLLGATGCSDQDRTYFWADVDQRTLETARALADGMFPGCETDVHSLTPAASDPLFDPIEAHAVTLDAPRALASVADRLGPRLDDVVDAHRAEFDTLERILRGDGRAPQTIFEKPTSLTTGPAGVVMGGPLSLASTITENLLLEYADGMRGPALGWGRLSPTDLHQIMALHTAYAELTRRTPYLARVRGSNLLSHVLRTMEQAVSGASVTGAVAPQGKTVVVIAGHDTNLSNLSGQLAWTWRLPGYDENDTPPGGALVLSLWQESGADALRVRVQFVAQTLDQMHDSTPLSLAAPPLIADVAVPGCGPERDHAELTCDWPAFQRVVQAAIDPAFVR